MKKLILLTLVQLVMLSSYAVYGQCSDVPRINNFTPDTGFIGSVVTIFGANFDSNPANNQVFFGATQAQIISASFGQLEVIVPEGANYLPISVRNDCGLSAQSTTYFTGIFCNTPINAASFSQVSYSRNVQGGYGMYSNDMDLDGKPELIVVGFTQNTVSVLKNESVPGTFNFPGTGDVILNHGSNTRGAIVADFDGDGKPDLALSGANGVDVHRNLSVPGTLSFGPRIRYSQNFGYQIWSADFNNDGKLDLAYTGFSNRVFLLINRSTGPGNIQFDWQFVQSNFSNTGIVASDIDGDSKVDIVVSNPGNNNLTVLINGTNTVGAAPTFSVGPVIPVENYPYRVFVGDFDKDGKNDLVTNNFNQPSVSIVRNTSTPGNFSFEPNVVVPGLNGTYRISVGDADGDGLPDIVSKYTGANFFSVFRNNSAGPGNISFEARVDYPGQSEVSGVVIGDLDGDFAPDISTSGISFNTLRIHRNTQTVVDDEDPTAICKDITVALDPTGNVSITPDQIDNGSSDACGIASITLSQTNFTCADIGANTVTLTVTDNAGNSASCTATVNVQPAAIIVVGQTTVCAGETIELEANSGDTYQWFKDGNAIPGATSQTYVATETGQYTVEVINGGGCSGTSLPVDLTVNDNPTVDIFPSSVAYLCPGEGALLTASQSAIYQWKLNGVDIPNATQQTYTANAPGNYSVEVIDLFGCSAVSSDVSVLNNPPEIDVVGNGDFGNVFPNVDNTQQFQIPNTGGGPLTVSQVEITGADAAFFSVQGLSLPVDVPAGATLQFDIVFNAPNITTYAAELTVFSNDCDEEEVSVPLAAEITCVAADVTVPIGVDVPNDDGVCGAIVDYVVTVTGEPAPDVTYEFMGATTGSGAGTGAGSLFNVGITTVTISVSNACGSDTEAFDVLVTDTEAPQVLVVGGGGGSPAINNVAIVGGGSFRIRLANSLTAAGYSVTYTGSAVPSAAVLSTTDALFLIRTQGNGDLQQWVNDGGLLITEWNANVWALNTANLIDANDQGGGFVATGTPITFTNTENGQILGDGVPVPYVDGPATEFFRNFGNIGSDVQVHAVRPNNVPVIIGDNAGDGYLLAVASCYQDIGNNLPGSSTEKVLLNALEVQFETIEPIVIQLDADGNAVLEVGDVDAGSTDNCGIVGSTLSETDFDCQDVGVPQPVTFTVTDAQGNSSSQQVTILVEDNVAPTAICQDITVQLDASGNASILASDIDNGSNDACGIANVSIDVDAFTCADVGPNPVVLTVVDVNGNINTCTATVTVIDGVDPEAVCQDITIQLDAAGNATITPQDIDGGSTDACGIAGLSVDKSNFGCQDVGANTVTLTVTDNNGNTSTCEATVTVEDNVAPTAICQDITIQLDAAGFASISAADVDNGSFDDCGIAALAVSPSSFGCGEVGANTVTLTVTDNNGNTSTCTAIVTVEDVVPPVAICQNITVQLDENGLASITAADVDGGSLDVCGIASTSIDVSTFDCTSIGANNVILTVTDVNGNSSTCSAIVTVEDMVAPTIECPDDITVSTDPGQCEAIVNYEVTGTDNCPSTTTEFIANGGFETGDFSGWTVMNSGSGAFFINNGSVNPGGPRGPLAPISGGFDIVSSQGGPGMHLVSQMFTVPTNVNSATISWNDRIHNYAANFSDPNQEFRVDILDAGMNPVAEVFSTNPGDPLIQEGPNARSFDLTSVMQSLGGQQVYVRFSERDNLSFFNVTLDDVSLVIESSNTTVTQTAGLPSGSSFPVGTTTNTFEITDANGNTATCSFDVTVEDNEAPMAVCQDIVVQLDASGNAVIAPADVNGGSSDNCGIAAITIDNNAFNCDNIGENIVTLTVVDVHGNSSQCTAIVTVEDNVPPVVVAQDITIQLNDIGQAIVFGEDLDAGSTDACGIASFDVSQSVFDCGNVGANTVTLTVTDVNGQSASADVTVTVEDMVPPVVQLSDITVQLDDFGQASISSDAQTVMFFEDFSADAPALGKTDLANWDVVLGDVDIFFANQFGLPLSSNAADIAGNVNGAIETKSAINLDPGTYRLSFLILGNDGDARLNVQIGSLLNTDFTSFIGGTLERREVDFTVPAATSATIRFEEFGDAPFFSGSTIDDITLSRLGDGLITYADDACGVASIEVSQLEFGCDNVGPNLVTVTVTDNNGNVTEEMATVTVEDNILPMAVCQGITIELDENGFASIIPEQIDGGSSDNCGIASLEASQIDFNCAFVGQNTVILTVTDFSGNVSTCEATVTVEDNQAPTLIAPDPFEVLGGGPDCGAAVVIPSPGVIENCGVTSLTMSINGENVFDYLFVPTDDKLQQPRQVIFGPDGDLYVSNLVVNNGVQEGQVLKYDGETGDFIMEIGGPSGSTSIAFPRGLDFGPDGNLYVASQGSGEVLKLDPNTGAALGVFVAPGNGGLGQPTGIVFGPDDNLYVADRISASVRKYDGNTGASLGEFVTSGDGGLAFPVGLTFGPDGNFYSTSLASNAIIRYDGATGAYIDQFVPNGSPGIDAPEDLEFGPDGNLYVSSFTGLVAKYDGLTGAFIEELSLTGIDLPNAEGLTFGPDGHLYVSNLGRSQIVRYPLGIFDLPFGVNDITFDASDASGNTASTSFTIEVKDDMPPVVECQDITVELDENGMASIVAEDLTANANLTSDNWIGFIGVILNGNFSGGNPVAIEEIKSTIDAENDMITLQPNFDPSYPTDFDNPELQGSTYIETFGTLAGKSFEFTGEVVSNTLAPQYNGFAFIRLFDANFGFLGEISAPLVPGSNFSVAYDNSMPDASIIQYGFTVQGPSGAFEDEASLGSAVVQGMKLVIPPFDNCAIESIVASQTEFDCSHVGENLVTLTVTDIHGNVSTCTATVTVEDNIAPVFAPVTDLLKPTYYKSHGRVVDYDLPVATDNCGLAGPPTLIGGLGSGSFFPIGTTVEEYSVTDVNGNTTTTSFEVTVTTDLGIVDFDLVCADKEDKDDKNDKYGSKHKDKKDKCDGSVIRTLKNRDVIDAAETPSISIVANVSRKAGSVLFYLDGELVRTDNYKDFSITGYKKDITEFNPTLGEHTLTAIPYTKENGQGEAGIPLTITFEVINTSVVTAFNLFETDKYGETLPMVDNQVIDVAGGYEFTIEAVTDPEVVGSVLFLLNGEKVSVDNDRIYALENPDKDKDDYERLAAKHKDDDDKKDKRPKLKPFDWAAGDYTLTAVPFEDEDAESTSGQSLSISFTIVNSEAVTSFAVVSEKDKKGKDPVFIPIEDGSVIDIDDLTEKYRAIRAFTNPDQVGSVVFELNGEVIDTEYKAPYLTDIFEKAKCKKDKKGKDKEKHKHDASCFEGQQVLTATPYSDKKGEGVAGTALTVTFEIINDKSTRETNDGIEEIADVFVGDIQYEVYPNPVVDKVSVDILSGKMEGANLALVSMSGKVLLNRDLELKQGSNSVELDLVEMNIPVGMVILQVTTESQGTFTRRVMKQ